MSLAVRSIPHPTQADVTVEAIAIDSTDTLREVRASSWHEGALALFTYPSSVVGFLSHDNPKYFGQQVEVGDTILKGPAGDFEVLRGAA